MNDVVVRVQVRRLADPAQRERASSSGPTKVITLSSATGWRPRRPGRPPSPGARAPARASRRSSAGSAWSQPQTCSTPWDDEEAQLVRRRPADVAGLAAAALARPAAIARSTETTMSPRCGRAGRRQDERAGRPRRAAAAVPGCAGKASGGSSGNESTSVGPASPMCVALSAASSVVGERISPSEAGRRCAGRLERARRDAGRASAVGRSRATPASDRQVDPPGGR